MNRASCYVAVPFALFAAIEIALFAFRGADANYVIEALISFGAAEFTTFLLYRFKSDKALTYSLPTIYASFAYLAIQLVINVLCVAIELCRPYAVIASAVAMVLGFATVSTTAHGTSYAKSAEQELGNATSFASSLRLRVNELALGVSAERASALAQLKDAVRFMDPVSAEATSDIEARIEAALQDVEQQSRNEDDTAFSKSLDTLLGLLAQRDLICKENK